MNRVTVFPVVHLIDAHHAVAQTAVARDAGAEGVFLINHNSGGWRVLAEVVRAVREAHDGFVGVNALDLDPATAFAEFAHLADGIWVDNAGIDERSGDQLQADLINDARAGFNGLYFGGVAFKYQRPVEDLGAAAALASRYMDVVCTSGPGTGQEVDVDKIATMSAAATVPLAVASGVSVDNLEPLARAGASYFLVATSIAASWNDLDPERTRALLVLARQLNAGKGQ